LVQGSIFNKNISPPSRSELITINQDEIKSDKYDIIQCILFDLNSLEENENNVQETLLEKTNNFDIQC